MRLEFQMVVGSINLLKGLRGPRLVVLLFAALLGSTALPAQEDLNRFTHATNSDLPINSGFALANPDLNQVGVFLIDQRQIHAYGLNQRLDVDRKIELIKQKRTYDQIVGNLVNELGYSLFFNNRKEKAVTYLRFSFEQNGIDAKGDLSINLKTEKLLAYFKYKGRLLMLTIDKKQPLFYFHLIDKDFQLEQHTVDASSLELLGSSGREVSVERLLIHENARITPIDLSGDNYPIGLTESSANFKLYRQGDQLYLTLDHRYEETQMLVFDLDQYSLKQKAIAKPSLGESYTRPRSNSFLSKNVMAQIVQNKDSLAIRLTDINTETETDVLNLSKEDDSSEMAFSQKKSWKEEEKALSTAQYFRKLKFNPLGISLTENQAGYQLTFGSWNKSEESSAGSGAAAGVGAVFGGVVGALITYAIAEAVSPEFQSFSRFANGKTTYAKIGLSEDLTRTSTADVELNLFEKIDQFSKTQEKQLPLVLFKFDGKTVLGLWDPKYEVMSFHGF